MRCVIQRSGPARVTVGDRVTGSITRGLVVLVAFQPGDTARELAWMAHKLPRLRVFRDEADKMNCSLLDVGGELLLVSQFTLYGDCRKGMRPGFTGSAPGEQALALYQQFGKMLGDEGLVVAEGEFGAMMEVSLVNDGPVTLILDREAPDPTPEVAP
jgi:D-tyrosyl-tRNA(Tyr) deacylase